MMSEQMIVETIKEIIEDNEELLNRDLKTYAECDRTKIGRMLVIMNLNTLYKVLEKPRPIFKCERNQ